MCRLLAYLGEPTRVASLVYGGDHSLYEQSWAPRELISGSVNADGYGVVWYHEGRPARIAEARPIWYDDDLSQTLDTIRAGTVIAALRNGTPGIPVDRSGLLPMVDDQWSFVLNGFVPDFRASHMRALRSTLPDELYGRLRGASDSETLFLLALAEVRNGTSLVNALIAVVRRVTERVGQDEAQLNMVLSDGEVLAAVRSSNVDRTNSMYTATGSNLAPDGHILTSEPPEGDSDWNHIPDHTSVVIDSYGVTQSPLVSG